MGERDYYLAFSLSNGIGQRLLYHCLITLKPQKKAKNLSKEKLKIVRVLENEPLHFDEIVRRLSLSASKLGGILSVLEVKGLIKQENGNYKLL